MAMYGVATHIYRTCGLYILKYYSCGCAVDVHLKQLYGAASLDRGVDVGILVDSEILIN